MDFLGVGVQEVIAIIILALIFIGPRELPRLASRAAKFLRDLRQVSNAFMGEWRRELEELDPGGEIRELKSELDETRQSLQDARRDMGKAFTEVGKDIEDTAKTAQNAANLKPKPAENTIAQKNQFSQKNGHGTESGKADEGSEISEAQPEADTSVNDTPDAEPKNEASSSETGSQTESSVRPRNYRFSNDDDDDSDVSTKQQRLSRKSPPAADTNETLQNGVAAIGAAAAETPTPTKPKVDFSRAFPQGGSFPTPSVYAPATKQPSAESADKADDPEPTSPESPPSPASETVMEADSPTTTENPETESKDV